MRVKFLHIRLCLSMVSAVAALLLPAAFPRAVHSCEVIVIKSADLKPYQDVQRGLRDASGCTVREMKPGDDAELERLIAKEPSAVVAIGTTVFKKVRNQTRAPVVYAMVMPSELSPALSRNLSGVSMDISPETYLNTMLRMFPGARKIELFYDPANTGPFVSEAAKAATEAGIDLVTRQVHAASQIPAVLAEPGEKPDILWMLPDPTVVTPETVELMLGYSFRNKIPIFSFSRKYVAMGAVASLDFDPYDIGVQAAEIVNQLSSGHPGPVRVYARKARLTVNSGVAAKMGIKINEHPQREVRAVE